MSETDISQYAGGYGPQDPNTQAASGPSNVQDVSAPSNSPPSPYAQTTIQRSEMEALVALLAAGLPMPPAPTMIMTSYDDVDAKKSDGVGAISAAASPLSMAQALNGAILSMWDSFLKVVHETGEQNRVDDIKRTEEKKEVTATDNARSYLANSLLHAAVKTDDTNKSTSVLAVQFLDAFKDWFVSPSQQSNTGVAIDTDRSNTTVAAQASQQIASNPNAIATGGFYPDPAFITAALASSPDTFRNAIGAVSLAADFQMSISPVADALYAAGPTSGLPGDYQAAAAMIAALLYNGGVLKASQETIEQAVKAKEPPRDINFAINFAKNILAIVTHDVEQGQPMNNEKLERNQLIRLMMTAIALNLLYRAVFGGMAAQEFASLLAGDTSKLPPEIKPLIEQLVSFLNKFLPTDPKARQAAIERLLEYVDNKNPVDEMMQTTRIFTNLLKTGDINNNRLQVEAT